jgi:transcription antitermination factor NusG
MLDAIPTSRLDADSPHDHLGCRSIRAPRWACVYTHPQAEVWANTNLRRSGYITFLPTHLVQQRDRITPSMLHCVIRPLFPRYLFLLFDHHAASWSPIRATPGVVDLIRTGSDVHYAPEGAIAALQAGQSDRATPTPPSAIWAPGMPCSLATGPFADHQGVVMSVGHDMALVALMMFGHLREVAVQLDCLKERDE